MTGLAEDRNRQVIPRWRRAMDADSIRESITLADSIDAPARYAVGFDTAQLWEALRDNTSFHVAADVLGAAVVAGDDELRQAAAGQVRSLGQVETRALAVALSAPSSQDPLDEILVFAPQHSTQAYVTIAKLKQDIVTNPADGLRWMDLAWWYTLLGQEPHALSAGRIAHALFPSSRYVLRSASRLFLHFDRGDQAYGLLEYSGAVGVDPWITSAALATADVMGNSTAVVSRAKRLIKREAYAPGDMSELLAAMSKVEFSAASTKRARKLLKEALVDPTENVVAQAAWTSRNGMPLGNMLQDTTVSSDEALAWAHYEQLDLEAAFRHAAQWVHDQPFSTRAALLALLLAIHLPNKADAGLFIAQRALTANPREPLLYNNAACLHAYTGDITGAQHRVRQGIAFADTHVLRTTFTATSGLIAYEMGDSDGGDALYRNAIDYALQHDEVSTAKIAFAYWNLARAKAGLSVIDTHADVKLTTQDAARSPLVRLVIASILECSQDKPPQGGLDSPERPVG